MLIHTNIQTANNHPKLKINFHQFLSNSFHWTSPHLRYQKCSTRILSMKKTVFSPYILLIHSSSFSIPHSLKVRLKHLKAALVSSLHKHIGHHSNAINRGQRTFSVFFFFNNFCCVMKKIQVGRRLKGREEKETWGGGGGVAHKCSNKTEN